MLLGDSGLSDISDAFRLLLSKSPKSSMPCSSSFFYSIETIELLSYPLFKLKSPKSSKLLIDSHSGLPFDIIEASRLFYDFISPKSSISL